MSRADGFRGLTAAAALRAQGALLRVEENCGIHRRAVQVGSEVQVWARDPARRADGAEDVAGRNFLSLLNCGFAQVTIHCYESLSMVDDYRIAVKKVVAGSSDDPGPWRDNGRACVGGDVHS